MAAPTPTTTKTASWTAPTSARALPEVFNGYEDEDGCPDRGYIVLIDERLVILDKVFFARRSAVADARSTPIIEAVAATLAHNPQLTLVEVAGHASRDEPGAQALSEARAVAVRDALVAAGVDAARLVTRGHGSAQPIAEGRTREANEQNRRVEFVILEPAQGPASDQQQPPLPGPVPGCPEAAPAG
jgi:OOP family OmpA-OmpF porin